MVKSCSQSFDIGHCSPHKWKAKQISFYAFVYYKFKSPEFSIIDRDIFLILMPYKDINICTVNKYV
jgi:hypothetical protein